MHAHVRRALLLALVALLGACDFGYEIYPPIDAGAEADSLGPDAGPADPVVAEAAR